MGRLRDLCLARQCDGDGGTHANLFPFQEIIDWFGANNSVSPYTFRVGIGFVTA